MSAVRTVPIRASRSAESPTCSGGAGGRAAAQAIVAGSMSATYTTRLRTPRIVLLLPGKVDKPAAHRTPGLSCGCKPSAPGLCSAGYAVDTAVQPEGTPPGPLNFLPIYWAVPRKAPQL